MRTRKVFRELQVSTDKTLLVGLSEMSPEDEKVTQTSTENCKVIKLATKENALNRRKPKRQRVETKNEKSKSSKEGNIKSVAKGSKAGNKKENLLCGSIAKETALNQSRIESFLSSNTNLKLKPEEPVKLDSGDVRVNKGEEEDVALITSDLPSETYWKELAETRRTALEESLLENELLHARRKELETENVELKDALDAAEKLLKLSGLLD